MPVSIQTRMIKDNDENNKTHIKKGKTLRNYKCPFFVGNNLI